MGIVHSLGFSTEKRRASPAAKRLAILFVGFENFVFTFGGNVFDDAVRLGGTGGGGGCRCATGDGFGYIEIDYPRVISPTAAEKYLILKHLIDVRGYDRTK